MQNLGASKNKTDGLPFAVRTKEQRNKGTKAGAEGGNRKG